MSTERILQGTGARIGIITASQVAPMYRQSMWGRIRHVASSLTKTHNIAKEKKSDRVGSEAIGVCEKREIYIDELVSLKLNEHSSRS